MRASFDPSTADRLPGSAGVTACAIALLVSLAACADPPQYRRPASACELGEATYECQVERYHNVNVE